MAMDKARVRSIPRWQVAVILVGFPVCYVLNSFAPWSRDLFGTRDRANFFYFFLSVMALHWSSACLTLRFMRGSGVTVADLGLRLPLRTAVRILVKLLAVGAVFVAFRHLVPYSVSHPRWLAFFPTNSSERAFFVFAALSAGFCEELVYRGFAITALESRGFRLRKAVVLSSVSFAFMHGLGGLFGFPVFFLAGLLFAGIYLGRVGGIGPGAPVRSEGRKNLFRPMVIHAIGDMTAILAP